MDSENIKKSLGFSEKQLESLITGIIFLKLFVQDSQLTGYHKKSKIIISVLGFSLSSFQKRFENLMFWKNIRNIINSFTKHRTGRASMQQVNLSSLILHN